MYEIGKEHFTRHSSSKLVSSGGSWWTEKATLIFNVPSPAEQCKWFLMKCIHAMLYIQSLLTSSILGILEYYSLSLSSSHKCVQVSTWEVDYLLLIMKLRIRSINFRLSRRKGNRTLLQLFKIRASGENLCIILSLLFFLT